MALPATLKPEQLLSAKLLWPKRGYWRLTYSISTLKRHQTQRLNAVHEKEIQAANAQNGEMCMPTPYLHLDLRCDRSPSHMRLASLPEMMLLMGGLHRHHNNVRLAYERMFSVLYVVEYDVNHS